VTRQGSKSTFPPAAKVVSTDYSTESLLEIFKGQDVVLSVVGVGGFAEQTKIIDAAVKAGVRRFIPSEFGSDTTEAQHIKLVPFFAGKKQVVDYLKSKEAEGMSWTAIVNGPLFDWGLKTGFLDFDLQHHTASIWDDGKAKFSTSTLATVGKAVAAALSDPQATANKYITIASHTVSQNEILEELEGLTGEKWKVSLKNTAEESEKANEELAKGNAFAAYDLVKALTFGPGSQGDARGVEGGLWNDRLGLPKEDLKDSLKKVLEG